MSIYIRKAYGDPPPSPPKPPGGFAAARSAAKFGTPAPDAGATPPAMIVAMHDGRFGHNADPQTGSQLRDHIAKHGIGPEDYDPASYDPRDEHPTLSIVNPHAILPSYSGYDENSNDPVGQGHRGVINRMLFMPIHPDDAGAVQTREAGSRQYEPYLDRWARHAPVVPMIHHGINRLGGHVDPIRPFTGTDLLAHLRHKHGTFSYTPHQLIEGYGDMARQRGFHPPLEEMHARAQMSPMDNAQWAGVYRDRENPGFKGEDGEWHPGNPHGWYDNDKWNQNPFATEGK